MPKPLANAALVAVSLVVSLVVAEGVTRAVDGLPIFTDWLEDTVDREVPAALVDSIRRAPGVPRDWFFEDPPPLPNRREPPPEWTELMRRWGDVRPWVANTFAPVEYFKAWNSEYARDPCASPLLRQAPGHLYVYRSTDGTPYPRYRYLPDATTPLGLVTNAFGWRGPPVALQKDAKTVRIAFVGASTTVNSHDFPFSYPELVGHWLNLWAQSQKLDVRFETLNLGREGLISTDIEVVVRKEALPARPELVVYYEGANQFTPQTMLKEAPKAAPPSMADYAPKGGLPGLLRDLRHRFALARRLQAALMLVGHPGDTGEWPKPAYEIRWPAGLDVRDPDLARPDLPLNLSTIVGDLDRIRADLAPTKTELAVSSFKWFVHDGLVLDPVRNQNLIAHLNIWLFPFRYRDLAALAALQNRVLEKYAKSRQATFIDVAGQMPEVRDYYSDAVHFTYGGVRLHAWIVLQALIPLIERKLEEKAWPKPMSAAEAEEARALYFTPLQIPVACPQ